MGDWFKRLCHPMWVIVDPAAKRPAIYMLTCGLKVRVPHWILSRKRYTVAD